ncbi:LysR family transcriptional regulator [Fastidiosibacter lacustris]|uniref:LysR family transcriptional regulator n=1 Tax=Fastidiosibacter lacustris TaxID=2056695 RepID=UPI000E355983|nr:LysR family transcriptional regulator [Fastidiosibacter lacustris]
MFKDAFSLVQLESFLAVAKFASFTKAAYYLGISKSAISQNIKQLELMTKVKLVIRTTRQVSLTEEGHKLFEQCQRLENEWFGIKQLIGSFDEHPEGELVISSNAFFAKQYLTKLIKQYLQLYPKMNVSLIIEERMPHLYQENIDVAFGVNWRPSDDVVARKLMETDYVFCATNSYLNRHGIPKSLQQLKQHQFIPHSARAATIVGKTDNQSHFWATRLKANNIDCMKNFVLSDMGIIQVHRYIVEHELKKGELVEVQLSDFSSQVVNVNMYYQKHQYVQPKIKTFVELAKEMLL